MPDRIRVLIVDDHPLYREGVAAAIEGDLRLALVGTAGTLAAGLEAAAELEIDVALIDLSLPDGDGVALVSQLRETAAGPRSVVLSASTDSATVHSAIAEGAAAFIPKEADRQEICDAIARVAGGDTYVSPGLLNGMLEEIRRVHTASGALLSEREREVLTAVAEGLSYGEIGQRLHVSASTVKTYVQRIFEKFGVSERAAAVAEGLRRGLIE
jgi:two-component system, NarL family, nitrate/nitrite response regulator NarL